MKLALTSLGVYCYFFRPFPWKGTEEER